MSALSAAFGLYAIGLLFWLAVAFGLGFAVGRATRKAPLRHDAAAARRRRFQRHRSVVRT